MTSGKAARPTEDAVYSPNDLYVIRPFIVSVSLRRVAMQHCGEGPRIVDCGEGSGSVLDNHRDEADGAQLRKVDICLYEL